MNEFEKENTSVLKKMKSIFSKKQDNKRKIKRTELFIYVSV